MSVLQVIGLYDKTQDYHNLNTTNMKTKSPQTMIEDSKKEFYAKPVVNIINFEPEGVILVSSNPTGSGEDMPWEW